MRTSALEYARQISWPCILPRALASLGLERKSLPIFGFVKKKNMPSNIHLLKMTQELTVKLCGNIEQPKTTF